MAEIINREKGSFEFAANLQVKKGAALDPRTVVKSVEELTNKETWPYDGEGDDTIIYLYKGLAVSVTDESCIYILNDPDHYYELSSWQKIGSADGSTVLLSNGYQENSYPENTGLVEFTSVERGDSVDVSISKLERNLVNLVEGVIDNEFVISTALTNLDSRTTDLTNRLSTALTYCGITTTALTDGSSVNPIIINSAEHTAIAGCVVFYEDKEFIFNGSIWEEFGYPVDLSGYKTTQTAVSSPTAAGNAFSFIDTISQNSNGKITVTKKNVSTDEIKKVKVNSATSADSATKAENDSDNNKISTTYLKISDAKGTAITLTDNFIPAILPEDTGVGEFASLVAGETIESAISKLDQNIAELVIETLDNEEVLSAAIADLHDRLDIKEIISDDPQILNITLGGNPIYRKAFSLEYITPTVEKTWEIPCTMDTFETVVLSMKCTLRQVLGSEGTVSFEYTDHYLSSENGNQLKHYFKHSTGSIIVKFKSNVTTNLIGIVEFSCPIDSVIYGGDSSTLTTDDIYDGGNAI